ncbi:hypothetical protein, partial [Pseudomonas aeruginosa]
MQHSLAVPGPNVLLILQIVSAALQPILNSSKKITQICFMFFANDLLLDVYFIFILDYGNNIRQKANMSNFLTRVQNG